VRGSSPQSPRTGERRGSASAIESATLASEYQRMRSWVVGRSRISRARPSASPRLSVIGSRAVQILNRGQAGSVANGALNPLSDCSQSSRNPFAPVNHLEKELISLPSIVSS